LKRDVPETSAGITLTGQDDAMSVENLHLEFGESGLKIVVTKLAD
jgi:hypothetical protein